MCSTYNILVISDLHLGEDLNPTATPQIARDVALAERNLVAFLGHHTRRRVDGLPWRLVINGDMLDILTVCVFPEDARADGAGAGAGRDAGRNSDSWPVMHPEEHKHGLGRRMDASCAKVGAVIDRHLPFVQSMARFLAAGNRIEIICGNHDAELFWPEVKSAFRRGLERVWRSMPEAARPGAPDATSLGQRLGFHDWFFYEPGVAWIEHGHQYDECCSFEYLLNPVDAEGRFLVDNVDSASLRYITNMVPDLVPHGSEDWTMAGYLRLTYDAGPRAGLQIARGFLLASIRLLREWRASRRLREGRRRRERHLDGLRELSSRVPLSYEQLRTLSGLQRRPVVTSLRRLMQVLMLDKLALAVTAIVLSALALWLLPLGWALLGVAFTALGTGLAGRLLSRGRMVDPALPLDLVPARILEHVDARFVVFGHTHMPVARPLPGDGWYYNTGTWVPSGKPGLLRCFTHLRILQRPDGPVAALCQWRDGSSQEFSPAPAQRPGSASDANPLGRRADSVPLLPLGSPPGAAPGIGYGTPVA
ncbi:hypothetical protein [Haliangium ochraceum]|nr:hypothetical protein [Haliangium ochraceum]